MSRTRHSLAIFLVALAATAAMFCGCGHDDDAATGTAAPGVAATLSADTLSLEQLAWSEDTDYVEYSFDDRLRIRLSADSWEELVAKARPTFTWGKPMPKAGFADMMWIDGDADGTPDCPAATPWGFRLARAIVWKPDANQATNQTANQADQKARWILLDFPVDDPDEGQSVLSLLAGRKYGDPSYPLLCRIAGQVVPARLTVTNEMPEESTHGYVSYVICRGADPRGGAVYEIGWGGGRNLSERWQERRLLYVWRDQAGRWRFLGTGPEENWRYNGHVGRDYGIDATSCQASVQWRGDPVRPVVTVVARAERSWERLRWPLYEESDAVEWPLLVVCRDATLDAAAGTPAEVTWSDDYIPVEEDDTPAKIVDRLSAWQYWRDVTGHDDDTYVYDGPDWDWAEQAPDAELLQRREKICQAYTERLRHLNPHLPADDNAKLPEGTRVIVRAARPASQHGPSP